MRVIQRAATPWRACAREAVHVLTYVHVNGWLERERERDGKRRRERWLEKSGGEVCAGPNVSCAYPADLLDAKGLHHSRGVTGLAVGNKFFFDSVTLVRSVDRVYPVSCSDSMSLGMFPRDESWMRNNKI